MRGWGGSQEETEVPHKHVDNFQLHNMESEVAHTHTRGGTVVLCGREKAAFIYSWMSSQAKLIRLTELADVS